MCVCVCVILHQQGLFAEYSGGAVCLSHRDERICLGKIRGEHGEHAASPGQYMPTMPGLALIARIDSHNARIGFATSKHDGEARAAVAAGDEAVVNLVRV